jgi:ABC-type antimicrobial peptide transport system permease subunit
MREALLILSAGLALGLALALVAAGRLGELLYNVPATDPVSHITAVVALGVVAVMAAWLPARRAARLDPTTALRTE